MKKDKAPEAVGVTRRDEVFTDRMKTRICYEVPDPENPFVAERMLWHGYDVLELARQRSLVDVVFLLLKGELPEVGQARQLEQLLILLAHPGPRHGASKAVVSASVSRTSVEHLLPIGLSLMGGDRLGAGQTQDSIRFFCKQMRNEPTAVAAQLRADLKPVNADDIFPAPGFGSSYGSIDSFSRNAATSMLQAFPENRALAWGMQLADALQDLPAGWLMTGVAAAVFVELGFSPRAGSGLYQLAACPGLLAQGIEMSGKPLTALPFVADENYHYGDVDDGE